MGPFPNQYPWYQAPYNPHIYLPPQYNDPYYQKPAGWHLFNQPQPKYPHLNPVLAADTTNIRYDLRKAPRDGILLSTYQQVALQPALAHPTYHIRIISKALPWSMEIRTPAGSVVTCSAVFEGLYAMLQEPIADSEWGIIINEKTKKEAIEKAAKARKEKDKGKDKDKDKDKGVRLKRIDWLGETTAFKGLEQDEEFEKKRLLPGSQACKETWVIKFGKP